MGLNTYCCLIFYGLTLIHLTSPLSQVVQLKCVMCNIYCIYVFICIYIYREREVFAFFGRASFLLFESSPGKHTHTLHFGLNFGRQGKSSLIAHSRTITHPKSRLLDIKGEQKWLPKARTKVTDWILLLNACLIVNMWSYAI